VAARTRGGAGDQGLRPFSASTLAALDRLVERFGEGDAERIKEIEAAPITTSRRSSTG
jgi:hypothetical protein